MPVHAGPMPQDQHGLLGQRPVSLMPAGTPEGPAAAGIKLGQLLQPCSLAKTHPGCSCGPSGRTRGSGARCRCPGRRWRMWRARGCSGRAWGCAAAAGSSTWRCTRSALRVDVDWPALLGSGTTALGGQAIGICSAGAAPLPVPRARVCATKGGSSRCMRWQATRSGGWGRVRHQSSLVPGGPLLRPGTASALRQLLGLGRKTLEAPARRCRRKGPDGMWPNPSCSISPSVGTIGIRTGLHSRIRHAHACRS